MIIFWRGWGIMALVYFAAAGILGMGLPYAIVSDASVRWALIPVGLLAGFACWKHGHHLNVTKPQQALEDFPMFQEEVMESVRAGAFRLPDHPPPTSLAQATGQAETYLHSVHSALAAGRNRHTFFFIPFQYFGFVIALWAIAMPVLLH
jgi:hypothetical protein